MKIVLDTDVIQNKGHTLPEILYLVGHWLKQGINDNTLKHLHRLGLICVTEFGDNNYLYKDAYISKEGGQLCEEVLFESMTNLLKETKPNSSKTKDLDEYVEIAKEMQECFPKGRKEGTNYQWRDSSTIIASRLKKTLDDYKRLTGKTYTKEQIVEATKAYVASFNGKYTYMQVLKYFITKRVLKGGEVEDTSQLLSFLENAHQENVNTEWTARLC